MDTITGLTHANRTAGSGPIRHRRITVDRFGGADRLHLVDAEEPPPALGRTRVRVLPPVSGGPT